MSWKWSDSVSLHILWFFGLLQIGAGLYTGLISSFQYQVIAETLQEQSFVFELRIVFLLLLSYILLNIPLVDVFRRKQYGSLRWLVVAYVLTMIMLQARSRVFEVVAVIVFAHLMWTGDRIKFRYLVGLGLALVIPNVMVLGRIGWPDNWQALVSGLFSFEYTILFNNLLAAAIDLGQQANSAFTFSPSLLLLLPSPLRNALGIDVVKSGYYTELSSAAELGGGGFSLLAEMFTNFGWFAPLVFFVFGLLIGKFNAFAADVGRVQLIGAVAPLLYVSFILAFRNDFGVFLKYTVQLVVVAYIVQLFISFIYMLRVSLKQRGRKYGRA